VNKPPTSSGLDLFGESSSAPKAKTSDAFGSADPFAPAGSSSGLSDDIFGGGSSSAKTAPPLTAQQIQQHKMWLFTAMSQGGGPMYDDGTVQIACKVEVRGSQCRFVFYYRNQTNAKITGLAINIEDKAGLTRFDAQKLASTELAPMGQGQLQVMIECMKPAAPGPSVTIEYSDAALGQRKNTIPLPIAVTTFNEPLGTMTAQDFMARWQQLGQSAAQTPGMELQEVLKPSSPIKVAMITGAFTSTLKFGKVSGVPDESEFIIYGAASLKTGATAANGDKISVGCLAKLEMNVQANALRVTIRTMFPAATSAILQTVKSLLA